MASLSSWRTALCLVAPLVSLLAPTSAFSTSSSAVLLPAVHWSQDRSAVRSLLPATSNSLYYAETEGVQSPAVQHKFLKMATSFKAPTVVLEHSQYISDIQCLSNGLRITFNNDGAFSTARSTWSSFAGGTHLRLVTSKDGCGAKSHRSRTTWSVSSISWLPLKKGGIAMVTAEESDTMKEVSKADMTWGTYKPALTIRDYALMYRDGTGDPKKRFLSGNETITGSPITISLQPTNDATSPWGSAYLFGSASSSSKRELQESDSLSAYCVDCGISGSIQLSGSCSWHWDGIESLAVKLTGNVQAKIQVGIVGDASASQTWSDQVASVSDPFFSVPDLISVGPTLTLSAELDLGVSAAGQALAGAELTIGPFAATLDFTDNSNTQSSGFAPQFSTTPFSASGEVSATATLGFPVSLGVGVDITPVDYSKEIALIDKPGIQAEATYATAGTDGCNGVYYNVSVINDVSMDFFGATTVDLYDWTSPSLATGCFTG